MALGQGSFVRNFTGAPADDRRHVTFMNEAVYDAAASERAGRPIYRNEEHYEISFPGNQLNIFHGRVTDVERNLYAREYEAFRKGEDVAINGTPIEELTVLSKAQVKELKYFNVNTVEDGAALTENAVQQMGMGARKLRELCQRYLEQAKDQAPLVELVAVKDQLEEKVKLQDAQLAEMNRIITGMQEQLNAYAQAPRPPETAIPHPQYDPGHALPPPAVSSSLDSIGAEQPRQKRPYHRKNAA